jgi:hypothetical protein
VLPTPTDRVRLLKHRRLQIKKAVQGTMPDSEPEEAEKAEPDSDAAEEALLEEMKGVRDAADHRLKKERKRRREQRMKSRVRAAQMALSKQPPSPTSACAVSIADSHHILHFSR